MDRLRLFENFIAFADAGSMSKAVRLGGGSAAASSRQLEALVVPQRNPDNSPAESSDTLPGGHAA
jgi:hypothetical protein